MAAYVCVKKCYRGGRLYIPGDPYMGKAPVPKEFKRNGPGLVVPAKGLVEEGKTLYDLSRNAKDMSPAAVNARRALGHKDGVYDDATIGSKVDPFADDVPEVSDDFLD